MHETVLTKEQLVEYLMTLRRALQRFDYSSLNNVIFINMEAVYAFINNEGCVFEDEVGSSVEELLDILEPYIPFAITDKTLAFYLEASNAVDDEEMGALERRFNTHARMDFINLMRCVTTQGDWEHIVSICEMLRSNYQSSMQYMGSF